MSFLAGKKANTTGITIRTKTGMWMIIIVTEPKGPSQGWRCFTVAASRDTLEPQKCDKDLSFICEHGKCIHPIIAFIKYPTIKSNSKEIIPLYN